MSVRTVNGLSIEVLKVEREVREPTCDVGPGAVRIEVGPAVPAALGPLLNSAGTAGPTKLETGQVIARLASNV